MEPDKNGSPPPEAPETRKEPEKKVSRRKWLDGLLGLSAVAWFGSVIYPTVRYLLPPPPSEPQQNSVKVGVESDFEPNSGTLFRLGNKPGILVRTPTGEFRAFIAICTHLDCTVQFKKDEGIIWCACHNGKYNLQGINIAGPPPRPLDALDVAQKGDEVYASLPG